MLKKTFLGPAIYFAQVSYQESKPILYSLKGGGIIGKITYFAVNTSLELARKLTPERLKAVARTTLDDLTSPSE